MADLNLSNTIFITITSDNVPNHPLSKNARDRVEKMKERKKVEHHEL